MKPTTLALPLAALALTLSGCTTTPTDIPKTTAATPSSTSATPTPSASPKATSSTSATPEPTPSTGPVATPETATTPATTSQAPVPTGTVITLPPETAAPSQSALPTSAPTGTSAGAPTSLAAQAPSSAAGQAICDYSNIHIAAAVQETAGAAGSTYITLTFTNTGTTSCAITGYPAVHYVDAAGQAIGTPAARATEWSANGATLQPGGSINATLRETHAQLYGDTCNRAPAAGYSIQAPGASQPLILNFAAEACSNPAVAQLTVGAVGATP